MIPNLSERKQLAEIIHGTGVEIGVARGEFSEHLLQHSRLSRLYSVDPWNAEFPGYENQSAADADFQHCVERLARFGQRSVIVRDRAERFIDQFKSWSIPVNFVYIDSSHSFAETFLQACIWFHLMPVGGILAGHDFSNCGEVRSAVEWFCRIFGQFYRTTENDGGYDFTVNSWIVVKR